MLRVGFIGLGMGRAHMKGAAAHADAKVVACCDIVEERRKNKDGVDVSEEFPGCAFYTDYKDMIANEELDAVVIASPDQLHKEMCEYCLAAGLHVLCEKPLALTEEDCLAIVAAAEKSDKKFMVGRCDNNRVKLLLRDHFLIIGVECATGKLLGNVYAILVLSALLNDIAASNNLCICMCSRTLHMGSTHAKTNKTNLQHFVFLQKFNYVF